MNRRSFLSSAALGMGASLIGNEAKAEKSDPAAASIPQISIGFIEADGIKVFYREARAKDAPVILLLHGFPASSFQYRELMPLLTDRYRVSEKTRLFRLRDTRSRLLDKRRNRIWV